MIVFNSNIPSSKIETDVIKKYMESTSKELTLDTEKIINNIDSTKDIADIKTDSSKATCEKSIPFATSWEGDIVSPRDLSMTFLKPAETKYLEEHNNKATVLPYGSFDPDKKPVVLIHGFGPSFLEKDMADELKNKGRQVFIVYYDTENTKPHENSKQIAEELDKIRQKYYPEGKELDIVGHSMGGVVARGALNYLHDPNWLSNSNNPDAYKPADINPEKVGFGNIRLRTVDTAIDGYYDLNKCEELAKKIDGFKSGPLSEMSSDSDMFQSLYSVPLPDVDFQNITASNIWNKEDWVLSFPELQPKDAMTVIESMTQGKEPEHPQLRNLLRGLRADTNYPKLENAIKQSVQNGTLKPTIDKDGNVTNSKELMKEISKIYTSTMQTVKGDHIWLMSNHPFRNDDAVDMLTKELGK